MIGVYGALFSVGGGGWGIIFREWGWVHCLIMPVLNII